MRSELRQLATEQAATQRSAMSMSQGYMQSVGSMVGSTQRYSRAANSASVASRQYAASLNQAMAASAGLMRQSRSTLASLIPVNRSLVATGVIIGGGAFLSGTNNLLELNKQLVVSGEQLNISSQELQVWQMTAENFNIPAEKMGSILKDVSDRFGEFANEEGGR
jgi:hypothetical protein